MQEYFKNKKVIITGHTGFKGSWLSLWMSMLGAEVSGISISIPTNPSHFELLNLKIKNDIRVDIYNSKKIEDIISRIKPDYVFHLAAQPLVALSYQNPLETFQTNVVGTANLLEALRELKNECIAVIITSDKSYDNLEISRGYHENDKLGGSDPYSGSKGAAELVINSYTKSFFIENNIRIGVGRAGNVIGGGDWAKNRIIPDAIRSIENEQNLIIRSPNATRPWQHVLEPLSGYISLAINLKNSNENNGQAFNFGPSFEYDYTVQDVLVELKKTITKLNWVVEKTKTFKESTLLKLDCNKAHNLLNWSSTLNFQKTISFTSLWYLEYLNKNKNLKALSENQILEFNRFVKNKKK
nr:CDP-glucose 4,6-dehydratase [Pelagibacteraceae bacterium]